MKFFKSLICFFSVIAIAGCEDSDTTEPEIVLASGTAEIVDSNNSFAFDFFRTVSSLEDKDNYMVSPVSLSLAMGMLVNGAEGNTQSILTETLGYANTTHDELSQINQGIMNSLQNEDLNIANSIWIKDDFKVKDKFLSLNTDYYQAQVENLDFNDAQSVEVINGWVAEKTDNKIPKIIDRIDEDQVLFLINALNFNANWKYDFDEKLTTKLPFSIDDDGFVAVDMMYMKSDSLDYFKGELFESVRLPYEGDKYSMSLMLPNKDKGVKDITTALNSKDWKLWQQGYTKTEASITLPKFKFDYANDLKDELSDLGLAHLFVKPDLSGISEKQGLVVSQVLQKTYIDVNEKGTEAAAVTVVGVGVTSISESPALVFDKPFLFVISERTTGSICFIGQVGKPEYEEQ